VAVRGVEVERRGEVAWCLIHDFQETVEASFEDPDYISVHDGIGVALDELRYDESVRVIVITGAKDGQFYRFPRRSHWDDPRFGDRLNPLLSARRAGGAPMRRHPNVHELFCLIEKPVIARVNGDVMGFGCSLLWGCDLIVAQEDARIGWGHMALGEFVDSNGEVRGMPITMTPSYGTVSMLYMPPTKEKEWLFLSTVRTAKELAEMNVFNYAVPAAELDAKVDEIVAALLKRPAFVLAHAKRVANKPLIEQMNLCEDLAGAYALLDIWHETVTRPDPWRPGSPAS
jgi:enoyl-CoA hydratase